MSVTSPQAELQVKHLEMVQAAIERMARNQFNLKGWNVALVAGVLALSRPGADERFVIIALLASVVFWGLDAYYLGLERRFRECHEAIAGALRGQGQAPPLFSMAVRPVGLSVVRCVFSTAVFFTHAPILVALVVLAVARAL